MKPALLWVCYLLVACTPPEPQRYDSELLVMGTRANISIWSDTPTHAATITRQIEHQLTQQGIDWYAWSPDPRSELRRLNAAIKQGQPFTASDNLTNLLTMTLQIHQASLGYFDPAVMPMTEAWGFADNQQPPTTEIPETALRNWHISHPKLTDLTVQNRSISSRHRDLQLDLGGIAKGYALDLAMTTLRQLGVTQSCMNLGGQLLVMGTTLPDSCKWINLQDPRSENSLGKIEILDGESISTSGDYQRHGTIQGQSIHHLLDPHTGMPVMHTQCVTVVASSAILADAASTALMAAGPDHWQAVAKNLGIRKALRIDNMGHIEVSKDLYPHLRLLQQTLNNHPFAIVTL